ncbi:MAG: 30S ribosomal protein S15 [Candidatus Yonathbacteria bacterium RIFCSPLOWO2_01_FULL_47_33b]|jgi:small subunit ribosomal protein S15|uniref:Small ribosomal subunit protein uS15 n=1 Tax=Candidatus Yonathbacteria bacterium RIFCSPLOWO2_01_FULL_47_33b TaxID=1802727 RepID=A0A1G2SGR7_9BACT|nr:MAG: 30S ribosomal protein S15 [Candidatus Yonathbacteria bacterium RIFCSPLOWO2_01_FULL_47_33b]
MITTKQKQNIIKKVQVHATDTGSPEAQVAILSKRIDELAAHLKKNHKDNHSRRGLLQMVADRRTHLNYLKRKSRDRYEVIVKKVGLK